MRALALARTAVRTHHAPRAPRRGRHSCQEMDAPLTGASSGGPTVLGTSAAPVQADSVDPDEEPQPLPMELRNAIRRFLSPLQRCRRVAGSANRAAAPITVGLWLIGFCGFNAFENANARPVAVVHAVVCFGSGVMAFIFLRQATEVIMPHVLSQLDNSHVSSKGTAALDKVLKGLRAFAAVMAVVITFFSVVVAVESQPDQRHTGQWILYDWLAAVAAVLLVIMAPMAAYMCFAIGPVEIAYILMEDRARQAGAVVQCATAATANYDALAEMIYHIHTETGSLSEKLQPVILASGSIRLLMMVSWLFIAAGPRPARNDGGWLENGNWYDIFFNEWVAAVMATQSVAMAVWNLSGPARITSACQKIATAVNDMRLHAGADGTMKLATTEQGHRIEMLKRYMNELNKEQGLGAPRCVLGHRRYHALSYQS